MYKEKISKLIYYYDTTNRDEDNNWLVRSSLLFGLVVCIRQRREFCIIPHSQIFVKKIIKFYHDNNFPKT